MEEDTFSMDSSQGPPPPPRPPPPPTNKSAKPPKNKPGPSTQSPPLPPSPPSPTPPLPPSPPPPQPKAKGRMQTPPRYMLRRIGEKSTRSRSSSPTPESPPTRARLSGTENGTFQTGTGGSGAETRESGNVFHSRLYTRHIHRAI